MTVHKRKTRIDNNAVLNQSQSDKSNSTPNDDSITQEYAILSRLREQALERKSKLDAWQKNVVLEFLFENQTSLRALPKPNMTVVTSDQPIKPIKPITRLEAEVDARAAAAETIDPYTPIANEKLKPFPSARETKSDLTNEDIKLLFSKAPTKNKRFRIPPPPIPDIPSGLVPPPPPVVSTTGIYSSDPTSNSPVGELPSAPEPPSIKDSLKLISIIGDLAIFKIDLALRKQNDWPETISLGPNETFDAITVIRVEPGVVTVSESGSTYQFQI